MGIQINATVELEVDEILSALVEDGTELCHFIGQFASGLNDGTLLDNVLDVVPSMSITKQELVVDALAKLAAGLKVACESGYIPPQHLPGMPCWLFEYDKEDGVYGIKIHGSDPDKIIDDFGGEYKNLRLLGLHGGTIPG